MKMFLPKVITSSLATSFLLRQQSHTVKHFCCTRLYHKTTSLSAASGPTNFLDLDDNVQTNTDKPTRQPRRQRHLDCSREGLNPSQNRFHAPLVHHERYSFADWPENHTFPMNKFERIAHALLTTCKRTQHPNNTSPLPRPLVASPTDFYRPLDFALCPSKIGCVVPLTLTLCSAFCKATCQCKSVGTLDFANKRPVRN